MADPTQVHIVFTKCIVSEKLGEQECFVYATFDLYRGLDYMEALNQKKGHSAVLKSYVLEYKEYDLDTLEDKEK